MKHKPARRHLFIKYPNITLPIILILFTLILLILSETQLTNNPVTLKAITTPQTTTTTQPKLPFGKIEEQGDYSLYVNEELGFSFKFSKEYTSSITSAHEQNLLFDFHNNAGSRVAVYLKKVKFEDYKYHDVGGGSFQYYNDKSCWIDTIYSSEDCLPSPKKLPVKVDAYEHAWGDGGCRGSIVIVPHPASLYVLEIITSQCYQEDNNGKGYLPNPLLSTEEIMRNFNFIR